jgi:hypothetical protein
VHKKRNIKDCEKYRGISLLNSGSKIYANIIENNVYTYHKYKLGDDYFTLKIHVENNREFNIEAHVAFLD